MMSVNNMNVSEFRSFLNRNKANIRVYGHIDCRLDDNGHWMIHEKTYNLNDDSSCISFIRGKNVQHFYLNCVLRLVRDETIKIVVGEPT
jgi:hypothetical protein